MKLFFGLAKWVALTLILSQTSFLFAADIASQRSQFSAAYADLKKGKKTKTSHLKEYPLYPYLEYQVIHNNLKNTTEKELLAFIDKYKNTPMADQLWSHWLGRLATQKKWSKIISVYSSIAADTSARCYYLEARIHESSKNSDPDIKHLALNEAKQLWMSTKSRPKACNPMFSLLKKNNTLTKADYWQRIESIVNSGKNTGLAKSLIKYLPTDEQKIAEQLVASHRRPESAMRSKHIGGGKYSRKVIAHAIKRIARKNYKKGYKTWNNIKGNYSFSKQEKDEIEAYLAVRAAFNHDPDTLDAFSKIPAMHRNDDANVWMARMALREGKWEKLHDAIDAMSDKTAERDIWQYWKARASSETGEKKQAEEGFNKLSKNATFYGFLSADRLGKDYSVLTSHKVDWDDCADNVEEVSPISRALEWFELGQDSKAYKEWFWALKHMNKDGKLAAAALALRLDKPILAVRTVAKTKDWNQVGLRFPLLYKNLITEMSNQNNVNPAWVYGIMRRESIFNKKAISSARAMGLMQLLPSTARYVGKKLGLSSVRKNDLLTPKLNVKLGSAYLSGMLKDFNGSYVKATAGYNAGPSRSVKWTPEKTMEADRWVESIPFSETRKYVRAVMAYTTIYDHKLTKGNGQRLSDRLLPVKARSVN